MRRYATPYTPEKRLKVINVKIKKLERNSNFFKKNIFKVIFFGIAFSLVGPFYSGADDSHTTDRDSIIERMDGNYVHSVLLCAGVYLSLSLLGHFIWGIQDKRKLKKLLLEKQDAEEKLRNSKS